MEGAWILASLGGGELHGVPAGLGMSENGRLVVLP